VLLSEVILQNRVSLALEGVSKSFGEVVAVDDVSFAVADGEFYSLLGPSGCGKTTTLRLIAGFEAVDSGRIVLAGEDVTELPPNRRRVNTVFQHYALFPHMTVETNVAYGLKQKRYSKAEVDSRLDAALRTVRLEKLRGRYPRELSGGQQQRVALARALINEPAVLLLDEPLAALDLKLRKAMQQELKKLQERVGITFLYVTHDQEEALTLSDRIAVMSGGRLLQEGPPAEIYERPRTRFVADFIGETNFFPGRVVETNGSVIVRADAGITLKCAPLESLLESLRPGMSVVVSVRPEAITSGAGDSATNRVGGRLIRVTYLGDLVQFHIDVPEHGELLMQAQSGSEGAAAGWRVGETVEVLWREDNALVLVDDGAAVADQDDRILTT
jgi:spermidine/putrescine transport system ATP-binding protein